MPNPKAATFRDSFATSALSPCWGIDGVAHGAGPGLVLGPNSDVFNDSDNYDLTESAIWARWAQLPTDGQARIAILGIDDSGCTTRLVYNPAFSPARLQLVSFFDPVFGPSPSLQNPPFVNYTGAENAFKLALSGTTLAWSTSDDGGVMWDLRRQKVLTAPQAAAFANCGIELVSNGVASNGIIASYNGGGVPHCPADPAPPPFAPSDGVPHAQAYTWRDAKGFTATTQVYLAGTVGQAAAAALTLRPLLEACTDAALNHAEGPYYLDRFAFGASAHGAAIGDQLVLTGITHRTGRAVTLTVPAAKPALFSPRGTADMADTTGPVGALADYWQRHAVTPDGEGFYARAARRVRGPLRARFTAASRRPTLGGAGL